MVRSRPTAVNGGGHRNRPASSRSMVKVGFGIDGLLPWVWDRGMKRMMSCNGFDEPKRRQQQQQQHPTHGHGSPTAIPSHPSEQTHLLLQHHAWTWPGTGPHNRRGPPSALHHQHHHHRAPPPPPIPALRFPFALNWVGARTRPLFFFYPPFFCPPFSSLFRLPTFTRPGRSWLPVAVSLHELVVFLLQGASHLGIVACLLLAAIGFLFAETPFLS